MVTPRRPRSKSLPLCFSAPSSSINSLPNFNNSEKSQHRCHLLRSSFLVPSPLSPPLAPLHTCTSSSISRPFILTASPLFYSSFNITKLSNDTFSLDPLTQPRSAKFTPPFSQISRRKRPSSSNLHSQPQFSDVSTPASESDSDQTLNQSSTRNRKEKQYKYIGDNTNNIINSTKEPLSFYHLLKGDKSTRQLVLNQLRTGQMNLTVEQFNEVVSSLSRDRRIKLALSVVDLAESGPLAKEIAKSKSVKSYTIMIDVYGKAFQLSKAFVLFYGMSRSGARPNGVTYNAMIAACARNNEPDLAYEVFEEMTQSGLKADKFTFGALIDSCAKCGQVDRAFEISAMMEQNGVEKDQTIYSALMDACGRTEQIDRALMVFEEMKRKGVWPNLITFSVLIDMCANTRQPERAFQIFSELKHWGFPSANVIVFNSLIEACAKSGWPERAELVRQIMQENGIEPNQTTFNALIEGWAIKGRLERAFEVLDRMITQHNVIPNGIVIGGLTDACRRLRETWYVQKIWQTVVKYNIRPSRIYYPSLIVMAVMQADVRLATAIILHAYARGFFRRASLSSEDPALHAISCAMVFYRHEIIKKPGQLNEDSSKAAKRVMSTVFKSVAMTEEDMDSMSALEARDLCLTWGDFEIQASLHSVRYRCGTRKDRKGIHRKEEWSSAAARKAKEVASARGSKN